MSGRAKQRKVVTVDGRAVWYDDPLS